MAMYLYKQKNKTQINSTFTRLWIKYASVFLLCFYSLHEGAVIWITTYVFGVYDIDKKYTSWFSGILSIMIIRRVLLCWYLKDYRGQLTQSFWFSSYSVWGLVHTDRNESFPKSLIRVLPFYKAIFIKVCIIFKVKFSHLISELEKDIWAVTKQIKSVSIKFIFALQMKHRSCIWSGI